MDRAGSTSELGRSDEGGEDGCVDAGKEGGLRTYVMGGK